MKKAYLAVSLVAGSVVLAGCSPAQPTPQMLQVTPSPVMTATPEPTFTPNWQRQVSPDKVLSFPVPARWGHSAKPGVISLSAPDYGAVLNIEYVKKDANFPAQTGTSAGDPVSSGQVMFLGATVPKVKLTFKGKSPDQDQVTAIYYGGNPGSGSVFTRGEYKFRVILSIDKKQAPSFINQLEKDTDFVLQDVQLVK